MIKLLKRLKRFLLKSLDYLQQKTAKSIDYLYEESPYNSLMTGLDKKEDFEQYLPYTEFRSAFENEILKLAKTYGYVKWHNELYQLNRFKGVFRLREAFIDHTQLNSRMRFSLKIIEAYFTHARKVYLTEHHTQYHKVLAQLGRYNITTSLYKHGDPLHQDMTSLTYSEDTFDLCLSFEDLEHIPDYKKVISELYKVTKPGGHVLLSTPFILENDETLVRAIVNEKGETEHLLTPEYHGDPVLPMGILCYYHFGWDLLDVFKQAGFKSVKVITGYDINELILGTLLFIVAEK